MTFRLLRGLGEIAADYDGLILDLWGVLHDGTAPYPGVIEALTRLRAQDKRIAILSNAPRRAHLVEARINEIGIARGLYDHLHSSGEEAWQNLKRRDDPFYAALGRACYHLGTDRDANMLEGLEISPAASVEAADFILNTGPGPWDPRTVADFEPLLTAARARDLPMVCANADLVVMHKDRLVICAGALAQRYESLGGRVRWHGKPFPSVYKTCFAHLGIADHRRILAVGDSLRTDIAGAAGVGLDSLLVAGGIHGEEFGVTEHEVPDRSRLAAAIAVSGHTPKVVIARFCW